MSNNTTRRAARSLGGLIKELKLGRDDVAQYLGATPSEGAWSRIIMAFSRYEDALDDLKSSRDSRSKDPAKASWYERQTQTKNALEAALDRLQATRKHDEFLQEASENYSLETFGSSAGSEVNADQLLREAYQKIMNALIIIERANSLEIELPTEANARAKLVREIRDALAQDGIEARASNGRSLGELEEPLLRDLTKFEQFLDALGICEELTVKSFSAFVRSALVGEKGG
jgi:hypothetical protein